MCVCTCAQARESSLCCIYCKCAGAVMVNVRTGVSSGFVHPSVKIEGSCELWFRLALAQCWGGCQSDYL